MKDMDTMPQEWLDTAIETFKQNVDPEYYDVCDGIWFKSYISLKWQYEFTAENAGKRAAERYIKAVKLNEKLRN